MTAGWLLGKKIFRLIVFAGSSIFLRISGEFQPNSQCLEIDAVEVGHNFVGFCCGATNFTARKLTWNSNSEFSLNPTADLKNVRQLGYTELYQYDRPSIDSSLVPLMHRDGFTQKAWYVVCANNFHVTSSNPTCRRQSCAVTRVCDCACERFGQRFLTFVVGTVPIEPRLYKTGFLIAALGASDELVLPLKVEIRITWDPFRCMEGLDCERPAIVLTKSIRPETFADRLPKSELFSEIIALDTKGEGQEFQVTLSVTIDLSSISQSFPKIGHLPASYRMTLETVRFHRDSYRNQTVVLLNPVINDYGDKLTRDFTCQVIRHYDSTSSATSTTLSAPSLLQNSCDAMFRQVLFFRISLVVLLYLMRKI